jgi:hypothetical protein
MKLEELIKRMSDIADECIVMDAEQTVRIIAGREAKIAGMLARFLEETGIGHLVLSYFMNRKNGDCENGSDE